MDSEGEQVIFQRRLAEQQSESESERGKERLRLPLKSQPASAAPAPRSQENQPKRKRKSNIKSTKVVQAWMAVLSARLYLFPQASFFFLSRFLPTFTQVWGRSPTPSFNGEPFLFPERSLFDQKRASVPHSLSEYITGPPSNFKLSYQCVAQL